MTADVLARRKPFIPVAVPAALYFCDVREAELKLGYGNYYEFEFSQEPLNALAADVHDFSFIRVDKKNDNMQVVAITFDRKSLPARCAAKFKIDEGTILEACCRIDGVYPETRFLLYVKENVFDILTSDADVTAMVIGELIDNETFSEIASANIKSLKRHRGRLEVKKNTVGIRRSLDAIHELFGVIDRKTGSPRGKHARWWDLALNQDNHCEMIEVIPNCDQETLNKVILEADKFLGRNEQGLPLKSINRLPRATGLVVGPSGTGKTRTGVVIGVCYLRMGGHVLLSSPTTGACIALLIFSYHDTNSTTASGDTLLLELLEILAYFKLLDKLLEDCRIVRIYGNDFEREEIYKGNSLVQDTDDSNATEKILQADVDIPHEAIEVQVILQLIREDRLKSFGFSEYSLTRQLMKRAQLGASKPCLIKYTPNKKSGEEEIVDVWQALREYIERLNNPKAYYHTWSKADKARYAAFCRWGKAKIMQEAHLVIATGNSMGSDIITANFGKNAKFIVQIEDEATRMREPDSWIGITKLHAYEKIRGLWLIGSYAQPGPLILSKYGNVNPFASQMELSLFSRLYLSSFPKWELRLSSRMHRDISAYPVSFGRLVPPLD